MRNVEPTNSHSDSNPNSNSHSDSNPNSNSHSNPDSNSHPHSRPHPTESAASTYRDFDSCVPDRHGHIHRVHRPHFTELSNEKYELHEPLFSASNSDLIGMFKRLGPGVLRVGENSVDRDIWTPNGAGQTAGQIAPSDVDSLAAFVKAVGWQCLYGINLGGAATGATTRRWPQTRLPTSSSNSARHYSASR